MTKYWVKPEIVPIKEGARTERGERVYTYLEIVVYPPAANPIKRVLQADPGIGMTEEYIEDTIQGCLAALKKDFPNDVYRVVRVKPNVIRFEYTGVAGLVQ